MCTILLVTCTTVYIHIMHNLIYLYVLKLNPFRQRRVRGKTKIAHCTNIDVCIIRTKWDKTTRATCVTLPRSMFYALNNSRRVNAVVTDSWQRFYLENLVCYSKTKQKASTRVFVESSTPDKYLYLHTWFLQLPVWYIII